MIPTVLIPGTSAVYGNYRAAVESAGGVPVFSPRADMDAAEPSCAGLLLPGGGDLAPWRYGQPELDCRNMDPSKDARELHLLELYARAGRPVLGICRGMQVINVFFGGTLFQDISGHRQLNGQDRLHTALTQPGSFLYPICGAEALVNSAHHQAVDRLGNDLIPVQWSRDGIVEGLCHRDLPVWAVQWHPERLRGPFLRKGAVDAQMLFETYIHTLSNSAGCQIPPLADVRCLEPALTLPSVN